MTEKGKHTVYGLALLGGLIKFATGILYTVWDVMGVWFIGNAISHVLFWAAFVSLFQKNRKMHDLATFFLFLSVNDLIDEMFFDNTVFGANEMLFFALICFWYIRKQIKLWRLKHGS